MTAQAIVDEKKTGRVPPRPVGHLLFGNAEAFQKEPLAFVIRMAKEHGDVFRFRILHEDWYFVAHPTLAYDVTTKRPELFHKPRVARRIWRLFLGKGILVADGPEWKKAQRLMLPGFHKRRVEAYGETMVAYTQQMLRGWQSGERRDFREDMTELTLRIVGKTLFDADITADAGLIGDGMRTIQEMLVEHINLPLPLPRWWPSPGNRRKIRAIENIEKILYRLIRERRADGTDHGDVLSMLVYAKGEDGEPMTDVELRDQAMTLVFAGHETTAHALTWMWYLLAKHPEVTAKLRAQITAAVGDGPLTVEKLAEVPYLEQVVKESMRFLPSVWSFMREPTEDVVVGDFRIPKGAPIMISPYVLHHDERFHPEPEVFRPERWTKEYERGLPKGAYMPFSLGPRICMGHAFAMMESKLILGTCVQRAEPHVAPGYEPEHKAQLSLHPGDGGMPFDTMLLPKVMEA